MFKSTSVKKKNPQKTRMTELVEDQEGVMRVKSAPFFDILEETYLPRLVVADGNESSKEEDVKAKRYETKESVVNLVNAVKKQSIELQDALRERLEMELKQKYEKEVKELYQRYSDEKIFEQKLNEASSAFQKELQEKIIAFDKNFTAKLNSIQEWLPKKLLDQREYFISRNKKIYSPALGLYLVFQAMMDMEAYPEPYNKEEYRIARLTTLFDDLYRLSQQTRCPTGLCVQFLESLAGTHYPQYGKNFKPDIQSSILEAGDKFFGKLLEEMGKIPKDGEQNKFNFLRNWILCLRSTDKEYEKNMEDFFKKTLSKFEQYARKQISQSLITNDELTQKIKELYNVAMDIVPGVPEQFSRLEKLYNLCFDQKRVESRFVCKERDEIFKKIQIVVDLAFNKKTILTEKDFINSIFEAVSGKKVLLNGTETTETIQAKDFVKHFIRLEEMWKMFLDNISQFLWENETLGMKAKFDAMYSQLLSKGSCDEKDFSELNKKYDDAQKEVIPIIKNFFARFYASKRDEKKLLVEQIIDIKEHNKDKFTFDAKLLKSILDALKPRKDKDKDKVPPIVLSPYEINQLFLSALLVPVTEWSGNFAAVLKAAIAWVSDFEKIRDFEKINDGRYGEYGETKKGSYPDELLHNLQTLLVLGKQVDVSEPEYLKITSSLPTAVNELYDFFRVYFLDIGAMQKMLGLLPRHINNFNDLRQTLEIKRVTYESPEILCKFFLTNNDGKKKLLTFMRDDPGKWFYLFSYIPSSFFLAHYFILFDNGSIFDSKKYPKKLLELLDTPIFLFLDKFLPDDKDTEELLTSHGVPKLRELLKLVARVRILPRILKEISYPKEQLIFFKLLLSDSAMADVFIKVMSLDESGMTWSEVLNSLYGGGSGTSYKAITAFLSEHDRKLQSIPNCVTLKLVCLALSGNKVYKFFEKSFATKEGKDKLLQLIVDDQDFNTVFEGFHWAAERQKFLKFFLSDNACKQKLLQAIIKNGIYYYLDQVPPNNKSFAMFEKFSQDNDIKQEIYKQLKNPSDLKKIIEPAVFFDKDGSNNSINYFKSLCGTTDFPKDDVLGELIKQEKWDQLYDIFISAELKVNQEAFKKQIANLRYKLGIVETGFFNDISAYEEILFADKYKKSAVNNVTLKTESELIFLPVKSVDGVELKFDTEFGKNKDGSVILNNFCEETSKDYMAIMLSKNGKQLTVFIDGEKIGPGSLNDLKLTSQRYDRLTRYIEAALVIADQKVKEFAAPHYNITSVMDKR
jgi:hypothetical protein